MGVPSFDFADSSLAVRTPFLPSALAHEERSGLFTG